MANELKVSGTLEYDKGSKYEKVGKSGVQLDVTGSDYVTKSQTIGTSEETINLGDITTPGYIFIRNLDDTNYIEIRGASAAADTVKVRAGGIALFELASSTPYAIADTADVEIEYTIIEA